MPVLGAAWIAWHHVALGHEPGIEGRDASVVSVIPTWAWSLG